MHLLRINFGRGSFISKPQIFQEKSSGCYPSSIFFLQHLICSAAQSINNQVITSSVIRPVFELNDSNMFDSKPQVFTFSLELNQMAIVEVEFVIISRQFLVISSDFGHFESKFWSFLIISRQFWWFPPISVILKPIFHHFKANFWWFPPILVKRDQFKLTFNKPLQLKWDEMPTNTELIGVGYSRS